MNDATEIPEFLRRPKRSQPLRLLLAYVDGAPRWRRNRPKRPDGARWQTAELRDVTLQDEAPTIGSGRRLVWVAEGRRYCKLASLDGVSKSKITMAAWAVIARRGSVTPASDHRGPTSDMVAPPHQSHHEGDSAMTKSKTKAKAKAPRARNTTTPKAEPTASVAVETKPARADSKQARLIEMMKRPEGVTVEDAAKALDWQAHTVRGAIAGALKKKLGLNVLSERAAGAKTTTYRIAE